MLKMSTVFIYPKFIGGGEMTSPFLSLFFGENVLYLFQYSEDY